MINKIIFVLAVCFFSNSVVAGTASGKVTQLMVHGGELLIFTIETPVNMHPCATVGGAWAISLSNATGKGMLAMLLSAKAQNLTVYVHGTNNCIDWPDRETPAYLFIN